MSKDNSHDPFLCRLEPKDRYKRQIYHRFPQAQSFKKIGFGETCGKLDMSASFCASPNAQGDQLQVASQGLPAAAVAASTAWPGCGQLEGTIMMIMMLDVPIHKEDFLSNVFTKHS